MNFIEFFSKHKTEIYSVAGVLFSGAGVVFVPYLWKQFFHSEKEISKNTVDLKVVLQTNEPIREIDLIKSEVKEISNRFNRCLELMNVNRRDPFTIAWIAKELHCEKVSELEDIFLNKSEPSFQMIEMFSNKFGVNPKWLLEGKGTPFEPNSLSKLYALDYLHEIKTFEPEEIYFVRAKTDEGQTIIVLKLTEWKFLVLKKDWHISDRIGGTGQQQLISFYELIKVLNKERLSFKCNGLFLEKEEFIKLLNGKTFPGQYLNNIYSINSWWDDLLDLESSSRSKDFYKDTYGDSFVRAQEVLKSILKT